MHIDDFKEFCEGFGEPKISYEGDMSKELSIVVSKHSGIQYAINWLDQMLSKGLNAGPAIVTLSREKRTTEQNSKGWPMWRDIAGQVDWYGQKLKDYEWKMMLTAIIKKQKTVPGIEGGFVVLSYPSSKLSKAEFSELIELTYAFGAEHNVQWSEQSKAFFDESGVKL